MLDRYTGLHTNTGLLGDYCIDGVAPGIYSLQIRHDAFATAVVESILVQVTVTDVDVGLEGALLLQAWPNPTTSRLHIRWELDTPSGATLEIFDIAGRRVRGWTDRSGTATRSMVWDLRDFRGRPVASGIYLVRLSTSESSNRTRRVVLMR